MRVPGSIGGFFTLPPPWIPAPPRACAATVHRLTRRFKGGRVPVMADTPGAGVGAERALILELARALHEAGAPAHRIEDAMAAPAPRWGIEGQFFTTPTSIFASFGPTYDQRTAMLRV